MMMRRCFSWVVVMLALGADSMSGPTKKIGRRVCFAGVLTWPLAAYAGATDFPLVNEGMNQGSFLTSKALELIRVQRQLEADSRYGSLADPDQKDSGADRLAAVLLVIDAFEALRPALKDYEASLAVLEKPPFERKAFKKVFNAYADNIYYADPDRANLYLLGGATPTNKQTIQYLYRNEALDNIEQLKDELTFLMKDGGSPDDALAYHDKATAALKSYLGLVPKAEYDEARTLVADRNT